MTSTNRPALRVNDPAELIEAIPYLIGFHPSESLVLLGFQRSADGTSSRRQVSVSVRVDLPPPLICDDALAPLAEALARSMVTSTIAVVMTDDVGEHPVTDPRWLALSGTLDATLAACHVHLEDVLVASADRFWSVGCANVDCCPPSGRPRALGCSITAAEATVAGLVALPDRESVERLIEPLPTNQRDRLLGPLTDAEHRVVSAVLNNSVQRLRRTDVRAIFAEIDKWSTAGVPPRSLTPKRAARFAVALGDIAVRDEIWMAIDTRGVDADELMRDLLRRLPSPYDAPPLFLYGWSMWRKGNGTMASIAAERALASDPGYSAARLLFEAVQRGLDPRSVPPLVLPDDLAG